MTALSLKCQCGEVTGTASGVTPESGNRVVCCCSDCQAFAEHLERGTDTLDAFGGTELFQMALSQVHIERGIDKLRSLRLTEKGLLRWYTSCCNTPVGNTVTANVPFVGVIHTFVDEPDRDRRLGPIRAVAQTQHARGTPDYPKHSAKFPVGITVRIVRQMLMWRLQGKHKPSVFFGDDGQPAVDPTIVNRTAANA